jgi:hypothetical protein
MPIAEPSSCSGSGPMKRLATNGHAYYSVARQTDAAWHTRFCNFLNLERETRLELATPTLARPEDTK